MPLIMENNISQLSTTTPIGPYPFRILSFRSYSIFNSWVMSLVWIAPTQFVKSSNLSQLVIVAEKGDRASVGPGD